MIWTPDDPMEFRSGDGMVSIAMPAGVLMAMSGSFVRPGLTLQSPARAWLDDVKEVLERGVIVLRQSDGTVWLQTRACYVPQSVPLEDYYDLVVMDKGGRRQYQEVEGMMLEWVFEKPLQVSNPVRWWPKLGYWKLKGAKP